MSVSGRRLGRGGGVMMGALAVALCLSAMQAQRPAAAQAATEETGAQGQGGGRHGQYAGMARTMGEVTAVAGGTLTVKTEGGTVQVVTTDNTRVVKERGPVRVTDLHPGDGLMAVGNLDPATKTLHAAVIFAEDAAQIKAMRENLGKTYITGRVTAVNLDDAKMTVERADHVTQTIGFDDTTSFKRAVRRGGPNGGPGGSGNGGEGADGGPGANTAREPGGGGYGGGMGAMSMGNGIDRAFNNGESITLADIKVGDYVAGTGAVKGGTFVPVRLVDSPPGPRRQRGGGGGGAGSGTGGTSGPGGL